MKAFYQYFSTIKIFILIGVLFIISIVKVSSQNTVGVITNSEAVSEGYNLFFPFNQEKVFLIDNDGQLIHYWNDTNDYIPGTSVYLLENGNLVRSKSTNTKTTDPIYAPGAGAFVDVVSWEGEILSSFSMSTENARLHHDIEPMPNGNILLVIWEKFSMEDALEAGRDPDNLPQEFILSEMIYEWDPETDKIVWAWHAWDHLIQNKYSDKDNYGNVSVQNGKIDLNYDEHDGHPDWLHINSIDYNPVLDQIVVSVPYFNEFWIIDHSTTTAQAKTDKGGNTGKGGEILYRFGNDKTYQNTPNDQYLYFQHDVHWLDQYAEEGDEDYGKILLFNNQMPDTTSIGMLVSTIDSNTFNYLDPTISPADLILKTYLHPNRSAKAYSDGLSNVQQLENNNILMFSGRYGYGYELNEQGEIAWEYRIPFRYGQTVAQGDTLAQNENITFKMNRYPLDYAAFDGKDLTPKGLLEELDFEDDEEEEDITALADSEQELEGISIFPNPFDNVFYIETQNQQADFEIFSIDGKLVYQGSLMKFNTEKIPTGQLNRGIYILKSGAKSIKLLKN
ncbi:aryl-sulfate sulfotransferase [Chondrinema litorale]|uniref:aryl-sulfate sulfotransferase n=1 Tax=Chondrinema litorale TaxID=2994555 RepID=UPI00254339FE|nr:aryl-sulfate sulfotransferase [Chondrinema litorale]UZR94942.1 aryl-sulfate sulfotransferase [Chondrinema litorale]